MFFSPQACGTLWHVEGQLWHWNPTSANGGAFAHSKKCSSPWWESFQWLQLENSHSSLTPDAHGGRLYCFISEKWGKSQNLSIRETMKDWEVFPKACKPKGQFNEGVRAVGWGGASKEAAEKSLWPQGEEAVMSTKGNHGYEFQGIKTLSTQLIPADVGWISLQWPNSALWKLCQPPAGQFVLILHTLLALLLDPQIEDPQRVSPNSMRVDTVWLVSQQNSETRTGLNR